MSHNGSKEVVFTQKTLKKLNRFKINLTLKFLLCNIVLAICTEGGLMENKYSSLSSFIFFKCIHVLDEWKPIFWHRTIRIHFVTLKVYDLLGKELVILVNEEKAAGNYEIELMVQQTDAGSFKWKFGDSESAYCKWS